MGFSDDLAIAQAEQAAARRRAEWFKAVHGSEIDSVLKRPTGKWSELFREAIPLIRWRETQLGQSSGRGGIHTCRVYQGPDGEERVTLPIWSANDKRKAMKLPGTLELCLEIDKGDHTGPTLTRFADFSGVGDSSGSAVVSRDTSRFNPDNSRSRCRCQRQRRHG